MTFTTEQLRQQCADLLAKHRQDVASNLLDNVCAMPKWHEQRDARADDLDTFIREELFAFVDYLANFLRDGDETFQFLYIGEKLKQMYVPGASTQEARTTQEQILAADVAYYASFMQQHGNQQQAETLLATIEEIHQVILADADKSLNVLFVGDCLFLDINAFIVAPCLADGIGVRPTFATSKNPADLRKQLKELSHEKFDLIFFSPFTFEFNIQYAQLLNRRSASMKTAQVVELVDQVTDETATTLNHLADLFDCPIHVHNSANIIREQSSLKRKAASMLTARVRKQARKQVNEWLSQFVEERNAATFQHLHIIDECTIAADYKETDLGAYIYWSDLQHPCRFSKVLADEYVDLIYVNAHLLTKKLVVCDLDNTLWDGIIGEGEVEHCHDRQEVLQQLKTKGVVLAINSKNDPKNVHFEGGTLTEDDFVYSSIDWNPKVHGMTDIQNALNLKTKDYVFIDDRADEREMCVSMHPQLTALDPCVARTWKLFRCWFDLLDGNSASDRTAMYKEREQRKEFLQSTESNEEANHELFHSLELKLTIREAGQGDLKRVNELINRTNQFNMRGTRTSFGEVTSWHESDAYRILIADATDRFGDMGTISILIAHNNGSAWEIPAFVLSCRVFGYGIERAVLNQVKRIARQADPALPITGIYEETGRNQPCQNTYQDNGFTQDGKQWIYDSDDAIEDVAWLEITCQMECEVATV